VNDSKGPTPRWVPIVSARVAEELCREMERIDGLAMNDAQVEQDPEAGRFTWTSEVARIIADGIQAHLRRHGG
jgi:predicted nucleic acid-binding protein